MALYTKCNGCGSWQHPNAICSHCGYDIAYETEARLERKRHDQVKKHNADLQQNLVLMTRLFRELLLTPSDNDEAYKTIQNSYAVTKDHEQALEELCGYAVGDENLDEILSGYVGKFKATA